MENFSPFEGKNQKARRKAAWLFMGDERRVRRSILDARNAPVSRPERPASIVIRAKDVRGGLVLRDRAEYEVTYRPSPGPARPAYTRPSPVVTSPVQFRPACRECPDIPCDPRQHEVPARRLIESREDNEPKTLHHRDQEMGRRLSHKEKIKARLEKDRERYARI